METKAGEQRIQTLIKIKLSDLEQLPIWRELSPNITNMIRHIIIRTAFGCYKIGLEIGQE